MILSVLNTAHHDQHCRYHHKNCHHHHQSGSALGASVRQKSTRSIWSTRLTVTHTSFARWVFLSDYGGDGDSCCLIIMVMIMMITMITMLIIMMLWWNLLTCSDEYTFCLQHCHFFFTKSIIIVITITKPTIAIVTQRKLFGTLSCNPKP